MANRINTEDAVRRWASTIFGIRFLRLWELITSMEEIGPTEAWWN